MRHLLSRTHICTVSHSHEASAAMPSEESWLRWALGRRFHIVFTSSPCCLTLSVIGKWIVEWYQTVTASETVSLGPKFITTVVIMTSLDWHQSCFYLSKMIDEQQLCHRRCEISAAVPGAETKDTLYRGWRITGFTTGTKCFTLLVS